VSVVAINVQETPITVLHVLEDFSFQEAFVLLHVEMPHIMILLQAHVKLAQATVNLALLLISVHHALML